MQFCTSLLLSFLTLALLGSATADSKPFTKFSSRKCGFEMHVPADWQIVPGESCTFRITPSNFDQRVKENHGVDAFSIELSVLKGPLETTAAQFGFEHQGSRWLYQEDPNAPAEKTFVEGYTKLHLLSNSRCYDLNGGYAGQCDRPVVFLAREGRAATFRGGPQSGNVLEALLSSFRLSPA